MAYSRVREPTLVPTYAKFHLQLFSYYLQRLKYGNYKVHNISIQRFHGDFSTVRDFGMLYMDKDSCVRLLVSTRGQAISALHNAFSKNVAFLEGRFFS